MQGKEKKRLIKRLEKKSASCMRSMPLDDHACCCFYYVKTLTKTTFWKKKYGKGWPWLQKR